MPNTVDTEIPASYDLAQITSAIQYQESMGFRFLHSEVRNDGGPSYNRAAFHLYLAGVPATCVVVYASAPTPAKHVREWGGVMLEQGRPREVVLYRAQVATVAPGPPASVPPRAQSGDFSPPAASEGAYAAAATAGRSPGVKILRLGRTGPAVKHWQTFLGGQGFDVEATGTFDQATHDATKAFQVLYGLYEDGVVGNESYGRAALLGFELVDFTESPGSGYPSEPAFASIGVRERQALFGKFEYARNPQPNNRENIQILGNWVEENIVTIELPQLRGKLGAASDCRIAVHARMVEPITSLWAAWESAGLLDRILSWEGAFVPRFIRKSTTTLSPHAWGCAFDINGTHNKIGAEPAWPGRPGCVFDLVPLAHKHGFYWGGHFKRRRDGMHFELSRP